MTAEKEPMVDAETRDWTSLPEELLLWILSNLNFNDVNRFHAVCKTWQSLRDRIGFGSQLLIEKMRDRSTLKLFHPLLRDPYPMDIPELRGAAIHFSKDGWLLMSIERRQIFFFNPFSRSTITLPDLPPLSLFDFKGITFTSTPTSDDCIVFGICAFQQFEFEVLTISHGEKGWNVIKIDNETSMYPSYCNPVFHNEKFYCLARHMELGVFDPRDNGWTVLQPLDRLSVDELYESYLVDCAGELMSVFVGGMGYFVSAHKWDESANNWEAVEDLGENMLFLSETTSFARKSVKEYMKNMIYFPRFHGNHSVFMSLEDGLYNTFGSDFSSKDLNNTTYQLECSWIEPIKNEYYVDWFGNSISPES